MYLSSISLLKKQQYIMYSVLVDMSPEAKNSLPSMIDSLSRLSGHQGLSKLRTSYCVRSCVMPL